MDVGQQELEQVVAHLDRDRHGAHPAFEVELEPGVAEGAQNRFGVLNVLANEARRGEPEEGEKKGGA